MLRNDRLLKALQGQNRGRPPIWLMRQAGRHLASYRQLRQRHPFLQMCHEPELIAEVTLLPVRTYGVDAAILFSDILLIPEAMGLPLHFEEHRGPVFERPLDGDAALAALPSTPDLSTLRCVAEGIKLLTPELDVPLIGFCGAPFTVASYMIEGGTSRDFRKTKLWMWQRPESFHKLLQLITDWSVAYLQLQIDAGVHAVQIFDSWAHVLAYPQFCQFSAHYLGDMIQKLNRPKVPVILFGRGTAPFAAALAETKPTALSFDWGGDLPSLRRHLPPSIALQGNLDPDLLLAPREVLIREAQSLLSRMKGDPAFIFNLGHGISPDAPEEAVRSLVACVQEPSHSRCAFPTIPKDLSADFPPSLLTHISGDMGFESNGVNSSGNLSGLLENSQRERLSP